MKRIAVVIPALNEEKGIAKVIRDFAAELPGVPIYVFDNESTDRTVEEATAAGAIVLRERRRGKGYVVQSMFREVEADVYVMVDGDDTYPAASVHELLEPVLNDTADMTVGARLAAQGSHMSFSHLAANRFFLGLVNLFLRTRLSDLLSGYRVMNRRLVKCVPVFVGGFEIETELTIKAVQRGYRIVELPTPLKPRAAGSSSKIRAIHDGLRILMAILALMRDYKPLTVFGGVGILLCVLGALVGTVVLSGYADFSRPATALTAAFAAASAVAGILSFGIGATLHTINHRVAELEYLLSLKDHVADRTGERIVSDEPHRTENEPVGPTARNES